MKQKGFTLVELLASLVVLAIILAIAAPAIIGIVSNASKMAFASDAKLVLKGIDYKKLTNDGFDPTTVNNGNINQLLGISNQNYSSVAISINPDGKPLINIVGTNKWGGFVACGTYRDMKVVESSSDCDVDLMTPTIMVLGSNPASVYAGDTYTDAGATATDYSDGDITGDIIVTGSVNTSVVGEYTITYTVTDSNGNAGTASRTVYVIDHSAPVITMNGSSPVNIEVGSTYSDAGSSALDDIDGDITSKITVSSDVNPNVLGTYTVTYNVSDKSGNIAAPVTRTVNVVDTTLPTVAFGTNGNSTYAKSRSTTVTVSDNVAVNTSSLKYLWNTSTTTPTEASFSNTFTNGGSVSSTAGITGNYYLWILAKDTSSNTTIVRSNTFNLDNTVPVITMNGSTPVTINVGSIYTDAGATATDNINGNITASIVPTSNVNPNVVGSYTVTYNVSDSSGNAATPVVRTVNVNDATLPTVAFGTNGNSTYAKSRSTTVTVSDNVAVNTSSLKYQWTTSTTAPTEASFSTSFTNGGTISSPAGVTGSYYLWILAKDTSNNTAIVRSNAFNLDNTVPVITMNGSSSVTINVGDTYSDAGATAIDNINGNITASIVPTSNVNPNVIGTYTVTYNVSDSSGNAATPVTRTVIVSAIAQFSINYRTDSGYVGMGYLDRTTYNGSTWTDTQIGSNNSWIAVSAVDANTAYGIIYRIGVGGVGMGYLYKVSYNGSTWTETQVGTNNSWIDVSAVDANNVFGIIYRIDSGGIGMGYLNKGYYNGSSWSVSQVGTNTSWMDVSAADANNVFGIIYRIGVNNVGMGYLYRDTYVSSWTETQIGSNTSWLSVSAADANTVYGIIDRYEAYNVGLGYLYRNVYSGSWSASQIGSSGNWIDVSAADANNVYGIDYRNDANGVGLGYLYRNSYSGSWTSSQIGSSGNWVDVSGLNANTSFGIIYRNDSNTVALGYLYRNLYSGSWATSQIGTNGNWIATSTN